MMEWKNMLGREVSARKDAKTEAMHFIKKEAGL